MNEAGRDQLKRFKTSGKGLPTEGQHTPIPLPRTPLYPNSSLNNLRHNPRPNHYLIPLKTLRIPHPQILRKIHIISHPKMLHPQRARRPLIVMCESRRTDYLDHGGDAGGRYEDEVGLAVTVYA